MNIINDEQIQELEKILLKKEYERVEKIIEKLNKESFDNPAVKIIYANSKSLKPSSSFQDKKIAFDIFINIYKKNNHFKGALHNACVLCFEIREYNEILNILEKFVYKKEYDKKIYEALYKAYLILGDIEKSVIILRKTLEFEPGNLKAWSALLRNINYLENYTQEEYIGLAKKFSENIIIYDDIKKINQPFVNSEKIKLGFMTPYFTGNAIDGFLEGFIKNIDKNIFEVVAFNLNISNLKSDHLKPLFNDWYHVHSLNDFDLINFIKSKNINIFIDLVGHWPGNRISVLKNRVAPIQISWLGYCNSTGLEEVDYIIADHNLIKESEKNLYSEKILYLENIWNSHLAISDDVTINDMPYYKNKYFTFGSFNNFSKISKSVIEVWSEILRETDSKLILKSSANNSENFRNIFLKKFSKKITNKNQIILLESKNNKSEHLKIYNQIDLALDPFPYNGVTTSFEAISMGVPVLTLKGKNFISRCGESININLGLNDFISNNKSDYVRKAINFSRNPKDLRELRKNLRIKSKNSALFNTRDFTYDFSIKLKKIWEKKINRNN